jgi:predicted deacylase
MDVWQLGAGHPNLAVVGGIHGDEPCGPAALRTLRDHDPAVERPVRCIVANEEALAENVRYIDEDLNRAFPGDPDADSHERRLAAKLVDTLDGALTLALHSTQSHSTPFAIVTEVTPEMRRICARLPIEALIDAGEFVEGRLLTAVPTIEVECGLQGSTAAGAQASWVVEAFLGATGALKAAPPAREVPIYRLEQRIPKAEAQSYAVEVENLTRVPAGEAYARVGDSTVVAEDSFYPVLLSAEGYEDIFGYQASYAGKITP